MPPSSHASSTSQGEPRICIRMPLVVNTPVPTMLATTSAVAAPGPSRRSPSFIAASTTRRPRGGDKDFAGPARGPRRGRDSSHLLYWAGRCSLPPSIRIARCPPPHSKGTPRVNDLMNLFHRIYDVQAIITWGGMAALVAVVFSETGLLVGFFLPGDSLLVTAGVFCTSANPTGHPLLNILWLNIAVSIAAVVGDQVGFYIGRKTGPKLFTRENSLLFNKKHLIRTHQFYEKHGGKTIIIARFMPIIRTFAPVVAGVGDMNYRRFVSYNVFGGIGWVVSMTGIGYGLASVWPDVTKHIEKLIILVIFLSLLPGIIAYLRGYLAKRNEKPAA